MTNRTSLAALIEAQDVHYFRLCADFHRRLVDPSRATAHDVAGGAAVFVDLGSPLNKALGLAMGQPVTTAEVEALEAFYREREGIARVDLCPYADPSLLRELSVRGYRPEGWKNVFVQSLDAKQARAPAGADISVRVIGEDERELWVATVAAGFRPGELDPHEIVYRLVAHLPTNVCFIAFVNGEPAGGGCVGVLQGVASLVCTSVIPRFRRRGVHAAILEARLAHARTAGCQVAYIAAVPGSASERNIERAGFGAVYSRLVLWRDVS